MTRLPERLVVASRGSKLALRQVAIVSDLMHASVPQLDVEVMVVTTTGDRDKQLPFRALGRKGIFVTEVERCVLEGSADIAVHSAKDLTAELAEGCAIVAVPARASVHDVVVGGAGGTGEERLASLPEGARVGTSSMRRRVLLREARPDVDAVELRGNIDTRLRKIAEGEVDVGIIAAAGLERLGEGVSVGGLDEQRWVPAPGQGALAIEALSERADLAALAALLDDASARAEVTCERAFARRLEGGCSVPLGCLARAAGSELVATGWLGSPFSGESLRDRISGSATEAGALGVELAEALIAAGGAEILQDIRAAEAEEAAPR